MNWVYTTRTDELMQAPVAELIPPGAVDNAEYLEVGQSSVMLSIFTAEVDVKLSEKISAELHRSTKKNPPRALKYELIYVRHLIPTLVTGYADVALRRGRTSMMQAEERTTLSPRQQVAFSRDCVRIWMGECACQIWYSWLLTSVQVWFHSRVHCQS